MVGCLLARRAALLDPISPFCYSARLGVWRSLVAHFLREEGVGGSNPLTPTNQKQGAAYDSGF